MVYLAGPDGYANDVRLRGFRDACSRLGMEASELGPFAARFQAGVRAADLVLAASVTAVVAYNDDVAATVVGAAIRAGMSVPGDLAVIGHDDSPLASMFIPALSSVAIDNAGLGRLVAEMALASVEDRPLPTSGPRFRATVVRREST